MNKKRCSWVDESELYKNYHDKEWGVPIHDDKILFEMLVLESFQAGLSWITILKKRQEFKNAFDNFDVIKVSKYDNNKIEQLVKNDKIIRHRGKILASINNSKKFIEIQNEFGSFDKFIWRYVDNTPIIGEFETLKDVPINTMISDKISKDLKKLGFKFVGSTIIYSFMQAIGMVNDHTKDCYLYKGNERE